MVADRKTRIPPLLHRTIGGGVLYECVQAFQHGPTIHGDIRIAGNGKSHCLNGPSVRYVAFLYESFLAFMSVLNIIEESDGVKFWTRLLSPFGEALTDSV